MAHLASSSVPPPPNPLPTQHDVYTNYQANNRFVSVKGALLAMLRKRQVLNSPSGFPFRLSSGGTCDDLCGVTQPRLLHSSYEFFEYVAVDHELPSCRAAFSYTAPGEHGTRGGNMSWQIKIPARDNMEDRTRNSSAFIVAQVELDPQTLETSFGVEFMQESHLILELLSISLEQGLHLTVTLSRHHAPGGASLDYSDTSSRNSLSSEHEPEDVVIVAKGGDGRQKIVHVYGR